METAQTTHVLDQAAAWWRAQLTAPEETKFNNGDAATSRAARGLSALLPASVASPAQLEQFERLLREGLAAMLSGTRTKLCVGVDYGPDKVLAEAAAGAGLQNARFPWKTLMWLSVDPENTYVEVSCGYGAPATRLS
jgi:hypothetical protein